METFKPKKQKMSISDISNILSMIVAVCALLFSTYQYWQGAKIEANTHRPIISMEQNNFSYSDTSSAPQFILHNYGERSAKGISIILLELIRNKPLNNYQIIGKEEWSIMNSLVQGTGINFNASQKKRLDSATYFFKLNFKYKDAISNNTYSDSMYYSWFYNEKDTTQNKFYLKGLTTEEAKNIDSYGY